MERVQGRVPPDIPPYVLEDGCLMRHLKVNFNYKNCAGIIAQLHQIKQNLQILTSWNSILNDTALERHFTNQKEYYRW